MHGIVNTLKNNYKMMTDSDSASCTISRDNFIHGFDLLAPGLFGLFLALYQHNTHENDFMDEPNNFIILAVDFILMVMVGRRYYSNFIFHGIPDTFRSTQACVQRQCNKDTREAKQDQPSKKVHAMSAVVSLSSLSAFFYAALVYTSRINDDTISIDMLSSPFWMFMALTLSNKLKIWIKHHFSTKAREHVNKLEASFPKTVTRFYHVEKEDKHTWHDMKMSRDAVQVSHYLIVEHDDFIPVDGTILNHDRDLMVQIQSSVFISGEDKARGLKHGDFVYAGMKNTSGQHILVSPQKPPLTSQLATLIRAGKETKSIHTQMENTSKRLSDYFLRAILFVAAVSFIVNASVQGFELAMKVVINIFFAACPCTLEYAISVPMMFLLQRCYQNNIILQNPTVLDAMANVACVAFDKTGTLTTLQFDELYFDQCEDDMLDKQCWHNIIFYLQDKRRQEPRYRTDKYANSVLACEVPESKAFDETKPKAIQHFPQGITATWQEKSLHIGSIAFLKDNDIKTDGQFVTEEKPGSKIWLAYDNKVLGYVGFTQQIRAEVKPLFEALQQRQIKIAILSGDTQQNVSRFVAENSLSSDLALGDLLPTVKQKKIDAFKQRYGTTMYVGDGGNDSLAGAAADVGVGLLDHTLMLVPGFDIAIHSFQHLYHLFKLKDLLVQHQKYSLYLAIGYLSIGVSLAGILFPALGISVSPIWFGCSMAFSSTLVMAVATILSKDVSALLDLDANDLVNALPRIAAKGDAKDSDPLLLGADSDSRVMYTAEDGDMALDVCADESPPTSDLLSMSVQSYTVEITTATCFACQGTVARGLTELNKQGDPYIMVSEYPDQFQFIQLTVFTNKNSMEMMAYLKGEIDDIGHEIQLTPIAVPSVENEDTMSYESTQVAQAFSTFRR